MDDKFIEFTHLLRQNGLKVSAAENMDTLAAVGLTGIRNRLVLKDTLRATLVKRVVDIPVFDELFDLFFTGLGEIIKRASSDTMDAMEMTEEEFQKFLEQLEQTLKNMGTELSELAKALLLIIPVSLNACSVRQLKAQTCKRSKGLSKKGNLRMR